MTFVSPPYILDFGKIYLDQQPDYPPEMLEEHDREQRELWGDRYPEVQALLWRLREMGIYYADDKPQNIAFGDED